MGSQNKKSNKPVLSLCIPTYNRCEYLNNTIDSIVHNKDFVENDIEIVISDNASTDGTQCLCEDYAEKYQNIHYFRNERNVFDENFLLVISRANGIYRKIVNDRYICLENALYDIRKIIEDHIDTKEFIYFSNVELKHRVIKLDREEKLDFKRFVLEIGERAINLLHFGLWNKDCDDILSDIDFINLKIWQAYKDFELINKNNNVIIYNKELFRFQEVKNKDMTYKVFTVFHDNYLKLVDKYKNCFNLNEIDKIQEKILLDTLINFMVEYKDSHSNLYFNHNEDLQDEIHRAYYNKSYYPKYKLLLFLKMLYRKCYARFKR